MPSYTTKCKKSKTDRIFVLVGIFSRGIYMDGNILDKIGLSPIRSMDREFTQDFVPIDAIKDGTIIMNDGGERKLVSIIEVSPPIFEFRTEDEQLRVLSSYKALLKNAPNNFQIKISTQLVDVEKYIDNAKRAYEKETDPQCKERIADYINFLYEEARRGVASEKRHFFIFNHEGDALGILTKKSEEDKLIELEKTHDRICSGFERMGCKVVDRKNPTKEIANILYRYYNRAIYDDEDFTSRVNRILRDKEYLNQGSGNPIKNDVRDIIAPKTIDIMEPDYITLDGHYRAYFYVDGRKYPNSMSIYGWLNRLANFGYGYDMDIFYKKLDSPSLISLLRQRVKFSGLKLRERDETAVDANEIADNYYGVKFLMDAIQREKQSVYDMAVLITIHAESKEELQIRKRNLLLFAKENDISLVDCKRIQEDAFLSAGFFNSPTPKIFNRAKHIVTTDAVVSTYPFLSFKVADEEGMYIGMVKDNDSLVMHDFFNPRNPNWNLFLLGMTGMGKTYTLLTILARLRYHGTQCYIITPDKQSEFKRLCEAVGGVFVDISPASTDRINVFDIVPRSSDANKVLEGGSEISWKTEKVQVLRRWLKFLLKHARAAELAELESIIVSLYTDFGITENNDSIYKDKETKKLKRMPTLGDFYDRVLDSSEITRDTKSILRTFVDGAAKSMNGQTNVDLNNKFIVFGLENLKQADDLLAPTLYITLEYLWGQIKKEKISKKIIAIDEGWELIDGSDEDVAKTVKEIFKIIRGLGGGAIFATQSIYDLFSSANNSGAAIVNSCYSKIILGMQTDDLKKTSGILELTETEKQAIREASPGQALFFSGEIHIPIKIKATPKEHWLFTTKMSDLETLVNATK